LIQSQKLNAMYGGMLSAINPVAGDIRIYAILGLLVGLAAALKAGLIAQILTFDAGRD
jgi:hypothetical protein